MLNLSIWNHPTATTRLQNQSSSLCVLWHAWGQKPRFLLCSRVLLCLTWVFAWILVWMYQCKVSGSLLGESCWDENTSEVPTPQWWNIHLHNYSNSVAYAFSKNPPLSRANEGNLQHPVIWEPLFGSKEMAGGNWLFSSPTCILAIICLFRWDTPWSLQTHSLQFCGTLPPNLTSRWGFIPN